MKSVIKYLCFLIILYVYMYSPPIKILYGGVNPFYILMAISVIFYMKGGDKPRLYLKPFKTEMTWFLCLVIFCVIRSGLEHDYMFIIRNVVSVVCVFVVIPFVLFLAKRIGIYRKDEIIRAIMIVSAIASSITMLCIFFPSFDSYVRNGLIQYEEEHYLYENLRRGYGIATALTSHYGYIQGTVIAICPFFLKENKWFIFFIPFIILSILVNARTGILIAMWGIMVHSYISSKKVALPLVILVSIVYYFLVDIMTALNFNAESIAWILDFNDQMEDISTGDFSGGAASRMLGDMIVWPSNFVEWLMGKGVVLYRNSMSAEHTDIGWFIQLNYGGLFYLFILYPTFVIMAKRLIRYNLKNFMIVLAGAILIVNTKSSIFPSTGELALLMLLYFILILDKLRQFGIRLEQ